jgi:hypothetical protein
MAPLVDRSILAHPAWRQHWERQVNYFDAVYGSAKLKPTITRRPPRRPCFFLRERWSDTTRVLQNNPQEKENYNQVLQDNDVNGAEEDVPPALFDAMERGVMLFHMEPSGEAL